MMMMMMIMSIFWAHRRGECMASAEGGNDNGGVTDIEWSGQGVQSTRGSEERRKLLAGSGTEPEPVTHFGVF